MTAAAAGAGAALQVDRLVIAYGVAAPAVREVSLDLAPGDVHLVVGANGAGKSTLLNAIAGTLQAAAKLVAGHVTMDGSRLERWGPARRCRAGLRLVMEGRRVFPDLTVADNLLAGAHLTPRSAVRAELEKVFAHFPALRPLTARMAGQLSGGEQQMLAIGRALMGRPRLLLLDEPSLGLAPLLVDDIFGRLEEIAARKELTMLIVEQNVTAALPIASHVHVLTDGQLSWSGPREEFEGMSSFAVSYLGANHRPTAPHGEGS
ncbi:ABC transporter ATP-binding protein [Pseudonocardia sp. H11422]|uniref:ABC transporter ATP-binding protein n=1 Tax=Pseudonocardia sp. H11422 TaxID=2835866 RepID=UPI001BDDAE63|nr:ABC transporter ATP-binding protein [Pseudonocardia sp. H11422]